MDHDLFELFSQYSGVPVEELRRSAANYATFNMLHWQECAGASWRERAAEFYGLADGYVFDLLNANRSKQHLREIYRQYGHWDWLQKSGPEVLEFGGGLGLACSMFRDLGRRVTYLDVDGPVSRFARWYFQQTGQDDIEVLLTGPEEARLPADRQWDFVFSDAVIEHVPDPTETVDRLAAAVRPNGILYLIIDAHNVGPAFPMHRDVYIEEILAGSPTLRAMQHLVHDGDGYNVFRNTLSVGTELARARIRH